MILRKILLVAFGVLSMAFTAAAQESEWNRLLGLLQKEAAYFQGKEGFIQPENSDYSRFSIQEASVSQSLIVFGMWFRGYAGDDSTEQYVKETVVLKPSPPVVISAEIYYDFSFYFKDFPAAQFLRIELDKDERLINKIENIKL